MNTVQNKKASFIDLKLVDYKKAWDFQTTLFDGILSKKNANRNLRDDQQQPTDNFLLFCEHPHVFTLGKSGNQNNLLIVKENLETINASYYQINRGGDITYHGPGQIVGYPVLDLENFFTDIHKYMRTLEEAVIQTLLDFNIAGRRIQGLTGVWIGDAENARKICALGVKTSRWVTMHGFALNVNTDLSYFDYIVPCGIEGGAVTSMEKELREKLDIGKVRKVLQTKIGEQFGIEWL